MSTLTFGTPSTPSISTILAQKKTVGSPTPEVTSPFETFNKTGIKRSFDQISKDGTSSAYVKQASILASGFLDKSYSDFEIRCGKEVYPVHKFVVFKQSEYFRNLAVDGTLTDQRFRQLEEDPHIVKLALEWLYTAKYTCESQNVPSISSATPDDGAVVFGEPMSLENCLVSHAKVYALAAKWKLPDLQNDACVRYGSAIVAKGCCDAFTSSLRTICETKKESYTSDKLASTALGFAAAKFNDFLSLESFCQFLTERGDVAVAIGKMRAKLAINLMPVLQPGVMSIANCPKCNDDCNVRISSKKEKSKFGTPGIYWCTKCRHDF